MTSLRARLFVSLAVFVVGTSLCAGVLAFRWAFEEAVEFQDATLVQLGYLAVSNEMRIEFPGPDDVNPDAKIVIEEVGSAAKPLAAAAKVRIHPRLPEIPTSLADGLHTLAQGGEYWRIFVLTRPDGSRLAVAQATAARDEIAWDGAFRTTFPLIGLVPCLIILVGIIVYRSLRPVSRLAALLDADQGDQLTPLPAEGIPQELSPFVNSINSLLERSAKILDQQRRFIAHAAHELRTPITALGLQAENLRNAERAQDREERLVALTSGIRRTAHLIEQMLDLAKYEEKNSLCISAERLDSLAKTLVADAVRVAEARSIDLGFDLVEEVSVLGSAPGLTALIRNLLDNAIRYTPDGGRVDVSVCRDGDRAIVVIEDSGPGIPEADLDRIFEPFNRGQRSDANGSGLGLSIVREIVQNHHGKVKLENVRAKGHTGLRAMVTLPLVR